jgi:DNA-binding MarR family transcriptional regulator
VQTSSSADLDRTADALLEASRVLVGIAARSLPDNEDVTLQQFRALVVLSKQETVTATHLATALGIHQSSATRLCDRLVRKKLIKRVPGVADRREIAVSLAAAGRRLVERVSARRRRELRAIAARMSTDARRRALEGLTAFAEAADEPAVVDRFGSVAP